MQPVDKATDEYAEMKTKAGNIERQYLAKAKVEQDWKAEKWNKKVLKVKVNRHADKVMENSKKQMDKQRENDDKVIAIRQKEFRSKKVEKGVQQRTDDDLHNRAIGSERRNKADHALKQAVKQVGKLADGTGMAANADREKSLGILARLRVAQAHADGSIIGLTPEQKKMEPIRALHHALDLATASPTKSTMDGFDKQFKDTVRFTEKESNEKVQEQNQKHENDEKSFAKKMEDAEKMKKFVRENGEKRKMQARGKRDEAISEAIEMPGKKQKEGYDKQTNKESRNKWKNHEMRQLDELHQKGEFKTKQYMKKEEAVKKVAEVKEKKTREECAILETKKVKKMELRNKALSAFSDAREKLILQQDALNGIKPYSPEREEPRFINKGHKCVYESASTVKANYDNILIPNACQEQCGPKPDCIAINFHNAPTIRCVLLKTGALSDPSPPYENQGCDLYQKIAGPGSGPPDPTKRLSTQRKLLGGGSDPLPPQAQTPSWVTAISAPNPTSRPTHMPSTPVLSVAHQRRLLGGGSDPPPPTPHPTAHPTHIPTYHPATIAAMERKKEMDEKQAERSIKQAAEQRAQHELEQKRLANDGNEKIQAEVEHKDAQKAAIAAQEVTAKKDLAEAERKAHNAEGKMQEMNTKLAEFDTQVRHCEGEIYRRRRTCICDDDEQKLLGENNARNEPSLPVDSLELTQKTEDNWDRRRYIRRRYVTPSPNDRRRRYEFATADEPARIPAKVCPCPPSRL